MHKFISEKGSKTTHRDTLEDYNKVLCVAFCQ